MSKEPVYGYFPGGDPREFSQDEETAMPEEIEAYKRDCTAWAAGERPDVATCEWVQTESGATIHIARSAYGLGVYYVEMGEENEL